MSKRILVTGGSGMVGSAFGDLDVVRISSKDYDLRIQEQAEQMFRDHRPERVIHLAARVGGLKANMERGADFYTDNIRINTNVLDCAYRANVQKLVSVMSTCIYPDFVVHPLVEKNLHLGEPHSSNYPYAYSKRMLDVQSRAYRQQYGCNFVTVIVNNLYGFNDYFGLQNSHVIPAIIRKMYEAKIRGDKQVKLFGTGKAEREFTYSKDLVIILLKVLKEYDNIYPMNVGNTVQYKISEVARKIKAFVGYDGKIVWSGLKLEGQSRKPSDNQKFLDLGWKREDYTVLDVGLKETVDWFISKYPNIRGIDDV